LKYVGNHLDSLGFFTTIINLYFFLNWSIVYYTGPIPWITNFYIPQILLGLSLFGFLIPFSKKLLLLNSLIFVAYYIYKSPVASNNQTTAFFLSILISIVLIISMSKYKGGSFSRREIQSLIQGPGKAILICMYFFGIYHKLNIDFFNPEVSCAVELYKPIAAVVGQQDNLWGQLISIYLTFIIEGLAILGLLFQRYRKVGLAVGVPFHILIGFTGYAFFMDFSTIVLAMYALTINDESLKRLQKLYSDRIQSVSFMIVMLLFSSLLALLMLSQVYICDGICSSKSFMPLFALYSIPIYLVLLFSTSNGERAFSKSGILYLIPFAFFLNGLSPYVGLKTEGTIAMFSNLHVEGGTTNHFLHGVIPGTARYTDEIIEIISSNNNIFLEGSKLVRYEFDRSLKKVRDAEITVISSLTGRHIFPTEHQWSNTYAEASWLTKKFLTFKPVDDLKPKVCTH
jgi:hypothetical protein